MSRLLWFAALSCACACFISQLHIYVPFDLRHFYIGVFYTHRSTALHNLSLAAAGGSAAATRALEQAQDADYESQNLEIHQVPSIHKKKIRRVFVVSAIFT